MKPKDLFVFVEENQEDITAFGRTLHEFLKTQKPNPYVALVSLSDIVGAIIQDNFQYCKDAGQLETLAQQTLEGYANIILDAADEVMRTRFGKSLNDDDNAEYISLTAGNC
jgi:hypothetical protein